MPSTEIERLHTRVTGSISDTLITFQDETRKQTLIEWADTMEGLDIGGRLQLAIKLTRNEAENIK